MSKTPAELYAAFQVIDIDLSEDHPYAFAEMSEVCEEITSIQTKIKRLGERYHHLLTTGEDLDKDNPYTLEELKVVREDYAKIEEALKPTTEVINACEGAFFIYKNDPRPQELEEAYYRNIAHCGNWFARPIVLTLSDGGETETATAFFNGVAYATA